MLEARLSELRDWTDGELCGADIEVAGVSIDSRSLPAGCLFVALPGARVDGHDYVAQAAAGGAAAALVTRCLEIDVPQLRVTDPRAALGRIAASWRQRFGPGVVAVTGSNGKTTVKEMLAAVLAADAPTLATRGNLNNDLGVPLTLLGLDAGHRYAVIEMGANHAGEIAGLCALARPDVAVITNAAAAHLEGFGSLQGVVRAKGEIIDGLGAAGVAVLNADDVNCDAWVRRAGARKVVRFGFADSADVRGRLHDDGRLEIRTADGAWWLRPALPGQHNLLNALAAFAAARELGVNGTRIVAALAGMAAVPGRMAVLVGHAGCRLVDDTYNANPGSLRAALDWLRDCAGPAWLALGDMAELGGDRQQLHADAGRAAAEAGVQRLFAFGPLSRASVETFGAGGEHFDSRDALVQRLREQLTDDVTLLVKGSRSMGMEQVVAGLRGDSERECN